MDIIVAVDADWGIGKDGDLLQRISADMKYFREKTTGNVLVMGRKTLESFPNKKPLPNRVNIVLTKNKDYQAEDVVLCHDLAELPSVLENYAGKQVFVAGGGTVYAQLLPQCERAYVTKIYQTYPADTAFPNLDENPDWEQGGNRKFQTGAQLHFSSYGLQPPQKNTPPRTSVCNISGDTSLYRLFHFHTMRKT